MSSEVLHEIKNCPRLGDVNVYIRGVRSSSETIILTVHDLGCDHSQYDHFIEHPAMEQITQRCTYVHVEIPGQADNAPDFPGSYVFPTFQEIAEGLSFVMDALSIKHAVFFGEGAGANILARLAMIETDRIFGAILINCTGAAAGVMESMRDMMKGSKSNPKQYLLEHRFGLNIKKSSTLSDDIRETVHNYKNALKTTRNAKNLNKLINSYMNRSSITEKANLLTCPLLLITASLTPQRFATQALFSALQKCANIGPNRRRIVEFVQVDDCANPLLQRPDKIAESFQYFIQGLGLVSGAVSRRISDIQIVGNLTKSSGEFSSSPPRDCSYEDCGPNPIGAIAGSMDSQAATDSNRKSSSNSSGRRVSMGEADIHKSPEDVVFNPNRKYSSIPIATVHEH